jgi:hypothetical protein
MPADHATGFTRMGIPQPDRFILANVMIISPSGLKTTEVTYPL